MFIINPYIFSSGYTITNALWFDGSADYLTFTPGSAGSSRTVFTFSLWFKRSNVTDTMAMLVAGPDANNRNRINFEADETFQYEEVSGGASKAQVITNNLFRDPTAWSHLYVQRNGTNAVTVKLNGGDISTNYNNDPSTDAQWGHTVAHAIGRSSYGAAEFFNGYLAEIMYIDGSAEAIGSFGEYDDNGVWLPVNPSGISSFGNNGFHLNFSNANALGLDVSRGATHPGTVDLQISFDGSDEATSTTDESANSHTVTFEGDAELDDAQYKFSPSSLLLDGTGDYVKCADNADWRLGGGTGDFTVEFFARLASGVTAAVMVGQEQNSTTDFWAIYWNNSAGLQFINRTGSSNTIYFAQGSNSLSVETWYHIALVRSGSVLTFYVNGSSVATASSITAAITDFSGELRIGHNTGSGAIGVAAFNGHIDEFRLINGGAVYNGNFTALTAAFNAPENKTNNSFTQVSIAQSQQVTDSPTDKSSDDIGNYWTLNPLASTDTLTGGNLSFTAAANFTTYATAPAIPMSGKWYYEVKATGGDQAIGTSGSYDAYLGLVKTDVAIPTGSHTSDANLWVIANWNPTPSGQKANGTTANYTPTSGFGDGSIIMVAVDMDNNAIWFGNDNTWAGSATASEIAAGTTTNAAFTSSNNSFGSHQMMPYHAAHSDLATYNFGATAFAHTPPTGFKALNTANLPAPTVADGSKYFASVAYTGNSDSENPRNVTGFQDAAGNNITPDWVWIKSRSDGYSHTLWDVVRGFGNGKELLTDASSAEGSQAGGNGNVSGVVPGGFTATESGSDSVYVNEQGKTYVAWMWKAGGAASTTSPAGTTASSTSVADHGGFSIGTYTGASGAQTIGHGLSRKPSWIIVKNRDDGGQTWTVYQEDLSNDGSEFIILNLTDDKTNGAAFNSTAPSATVFSVGSGAAASNTNGEDYVFYAFAKTPGAIASGMYTGNGSADGPAVTCDDGASGFAPAWLMIKNINDDGTDWRVIDSVRDGGINDGAANAVLNAGRTTVESSASPGTIIDKLATGFKIRGTDGNTNTSSKNYIYLAFAENPFGGDTVAQGKAR